MALSTGASFARSFLVAHQLNPADFSYYASIIGAATFGGYFLSLGKVERTVKIFARYCASGQTYRIAPELLAAFKVISIRAIVIGAASFILLVLLNKASYFHFLAQAILIAWSSCLLGLYASVMRANGSLKYFSSLTFLRALAISILSVAAAYWFALQGSLWGEAIGNLFALILMRAAGLAILKRTNTEQVRNPAASGAESATDANDYGGQWLFWSFMTGSVVIYLDRWFVTLNSDKLTASSYAFVMLFVTGALALAAIIAQKVGPVLVRMQHNRASLSEQCRYVVRWSAFFALIAISGISACFALAWNVPLFGALVSKYEMSVSVLPVLLTLAVLQATTIIDWLFIANDKEKNVFWGALLMSSATAVGFSIASSVHAGLYGFLIASISGRVFQFAYQMLLIQRIMRPKSAEAR